MRRRNRAGRNAASGVRFAVKGDENAFQDIYDKADAHEKEAIDAYRYAMNGASVAELSGNEFQKDNIPITDKVTAYFAEQCNGVAVNPEIGAVRLDREGVKDSLGHGIGRIKAAAYAAVPQIIENGKICDRQENWKGRGYDTVVIVAPLEIAGKPYIGEVVVKQGTDRQGFYLHEVELKEKLENASKTANGSAFPASRLILSQLLDKIKLRYGKNDGNVRFSIIGEEGAAAAAEWYGRQDAEMWKMLGLDLSTQQGNAIKRLEDLSVAKRMAEAGKEAETIKLATGWEKGADGKWRTETDDNWQFSPEFLRLEPYESLPIDRCIQEGTELFSAYPDLREFNVRLSTSLEMQQSKGWFDRDEHEFVLQQDGLPAMKKTLIHEIQHYIQEQEGFAPGGNLYTASRLAATGNYSSTELADAYRKFHDNVKLLPGDLYENIGRVLHEDSFRNFRDVLGEELGELWGSGETAIDFMRNAYDSSNRETFLQIYEAELEKAEKGHLDAFSLYRRLAGEVEARNAERRSGLSLEERLRTLLANTEDVAEQDKIYLEKNTADLPLSREEDSAAFQRWFADSKVVDAEGKPLVVYHGSPNDFTVFSYKFNNSNGQAEGRGFYFTDNRSYAEGYQSDGGKLFEVYLSLQNPLNPKELTITKPELRKIINAIDPDGDGISNYAEDSRGYPGSAWRNRALDSAVNAIYDSSENDADIIGELYSSFGGGTVLEEVRRISGYDGFMTRNENGDTVYVVFSPTQIKSATENVGTFDPENPDIRFSESGQAEELENLMAKRVAPIIRDANGRDSDVREEVRTLLSQAGFDLSDAELEEIIKRAQQQVRRFRSLQRLTEENDYIRATDPWIATLQDVYSTNFKISTAGKYATEDFSGTWIGKDGGVAPDEAARTLSAAFGQEITDDDVVDHFRYLKRRDILAKRREENKAMEEALREEERLHDMELAEQILAGEFPFDDEFIGSNPRVAKMVRDMVSPAKPGEPRADWATVRAALGQENPQEFAKGYFEGREAGRQEYRERLREARKNTTDIRTLQEIATREVRRVLPEELQGAFLKRIAELGKFRTEPSPAYPQGRRAYELDKLIRDINSYEIRSRIIALADRYTAKRNYKGIPVSILENMQRELDEIRTVLRLSPEAVALKIAENSAAIEAQEAADASAEEIQTLQHENMVLSTFGNLDRKSPQELEQAMGALELVISTGKLRFATKLAKRQEQIAAMRLEALDDAGNQGKKARTLSGGIVTKQAGLRTLLDWVSLKSGKSFDESFSGKMMRRVEDATEEEKTRLRNMQKSFDRLLEQVGVKTLREKMEFFRELMRKEEKTGVHRLVYTSSRKFVNGEERLVNRRKAKRRLITPELARKLLADHDSGKAPMAYYSAEFLRLQLAAHDAGVKAEVNIMGTQEENDQIARYKLEAEGGKTLQLIEPTEEEFSHREELSLTRDAAMQIWLSWQQPDVRAGMEWNGWSAESIRELEKFLGERYLTLAKGLRSLIAAGRQELNARVEEFYGAGLPEKPNYFPAKHLESLGKEINSDTLLGSEYGQMSVSPGFLIARKFHLLDVDSDGTAIGSFLSNQMQAAHFLAFGRVIRDARAVYNDRDVRERITAEYGRDVFEQLIDRFDVLAKGGRKLTDAAHVLNSLYKVWVPAMIAVNASSAAKQIAGVVNYMNDIPAGAFFRGFADANTKSELFRRFIADNQVQEYLANRMEGGFDRDLSFLLNSTRNIENYNPLASSIIEYGTMPTRLADKWCTVRGGFAVFQYHYNEVLKRTGNEREAWDTAVRMWRRSTDETQQSGSLKDQNLYQSMGGLMRYLTVFMSAPIQMMNREFMAVNRMLAGTGERRAEARRELARMVLINHVVCPFLMEALTQFFRAGFDWDEYEFGSFLTGFLLGPFEGFVVFGKLIRALGDRLTGSGGWQQSFQALPMADSAIQSVSTLMKIAQFDEFDSDDWVRQIKAAADLTMTAGSLVPGGGLAAAVGGAVSSTVRELRRIFRIVESAE
ncbi:LPD23 domain-containing protein [uncultured Victivallis sp.]|uniref:ADP-ribosyltransferase-containing protein n=1 Tax=uncultured Victivallis sp. TaxID=354118 RepID=UPI0025F64327|nr:LPD23 domain-containing protein [uncultured Victivallis sp.]